MDMNEVIKEIILNYIISQKNSGEPPSDKVGEICSIWLGDRVYVKAKIRYLGKMHKVDSPGKVFSVGSERVGVALDEFLDYKDALIVHLKERT